MLTKLAANDITLIYINVLSAARNEMQETGPGAKA
jgi:hypothetical protein